MCCRGKRIIFPLRLISIFLWSYDSGYNPIIRDFPLWLRIICRIICEFFVLEGRTIFSFTKKQNMLDALSPRNVTKSRCSRVDQVITVGTAIGIIILCYILRQLEPDETMDEYIPYQKGRKTLGFADIFQMPTSLVSLLN